MATITVVMHDGNQVKLPESSFIFQGGQGSIYGVGKRVFKVYTDTKANYDWVERKVQALAPLGKNPLIVAPTGILRNPAGKIIGYHMPLQKGDSLVSLYPNSAWQKLGLTEKDAADISLRLREIVAFAHSNKALLIDGNEMNYLVENKLPHAIDVDSWQIGEFKATAIMASIRDYHAKEFTELTDWFAWGIVTFQLFTGLHPYRGKHPSFKPGQMQERMERNLSLFDKDVSTPPFMRPLDTIPKNLLAWYRDVFQEGKRTPPPDEKSYKEAPAIPTPAATTLRTVQTSSGSITYTKVCEAPSDIVTLLTGRVLVLTDGVYRLIGDKPKLAYKFKVPGHHSVVVTKEGNLVILEPMLPAALNFWVVVVPPNGQVYNSSCPLSIREHFVSGNRVFGVQEGGSGLLELEILVLPNFSAIVGVKSTWGAMVNSLKYDDLTGFGVYFVVGGTAVLVAPQETGLISFVVPQLNQKRIVTIWGHGTFFTCVTLERDGTYQKHEFFFDAGGVTKYWQSPTDSSQLNVAVTSKGAVATIPTDGELVLFTADSTNVRKVSDSKLSLGSPLVFVDGKMSMIEGRYLWDISLK